MRKLVTKEFQPLQRRPLCSSSSSSEIYRKKPLGIQQVKQVSKANFSVALDEIKGHIRDCDFIAVSSGKSGAFSAPWRRPISFLDTPETAYLKAKDSAEKYQLLHLAVCPFKIVQQSDTTKLVAYPVQESSARYRIGNPVPSIGQATSSSCLSVADAIFVERIKTRVKHWRDACKDSKKTSEDALFTSLRKLLLKGEVYGSRPCINIDVCNDRQVELVLEMLNVFPDDLVPLIIPDKGGVTKVVRIVLTSSDEDKNLLKSELQNLEEELGKQFRGFREVIDAMSTSNKPIIAYNCLTDFTFIHSMFIGPLPPSMSEFMCSIRLVFSNILDVVHLWREIGPLKKADNLSAAFAYLRRQFFVPLDMDIPHQAEGSVGTNLGRNVLRIANLFVKVASILKISPPTSQPVASHRTTTVEDYTNIFYPSCTHLQEPLDENIEVWMDKGRTVSTDSLVLLWGFRSGMSAGTLKRQLHGSHDVLFDDFEVRLVDKSCAIVVFWNPGSAEVLLKEIDSGAVGFTALREMIFVGLKAAGYESYRRACRSGVQEVFLADALEKMTEPANNHLVESGMEASEIQWCNGSIRLNDL